MRIVGETRNDEAASVQQTASCLNACASVLKSDHSWQLLPDETSTQYNLMEGFSLLKNRSLEFSYSHFVQAAGGK